jgi:hypothetical protein
VTPSQPTVPVGMTENDRARRASPSFVAKSLQVESCRCFLTGELYFESARLEFVTRQSRFRERSQKGNGFDAEGCDAGLTIRDRGEGSELEIKVRRELRDPQIEAPEVVTERLPFEDAVLASHRARRR